MVQRCYDLCAMTTRIHFVSIIYFIFLLLAFASCKKDDAATTPDTPGTLFNKLIVVRNFGESLPAGSEPLTDQSPVYYSLETNAAAPVEYKRTNRWDVSFSSTYRSFMGGNNGADKTNFGVDGPGKGGIMIVAKNFDEVTDIPADNLFRTGSSLIGTDDSGAFGSGVGYYLYDFDGTKKGDGSFDKQHVAYVLQEGRTIIVRTAKGNYAKIKMQSIYKDMLDPTTWVRNAPHPFFSFEYVLAKAGSTKFIIEN